MPKNPGCFPSLHATYDFCTKLSTKADKNLTNIFHFQGMAQQIKEKEKEILMCNKPLLVSGDQRHGFQCNILGVTTARFQQSNYLRKKLTSVQVGKTIINVVINYRHPKVSPSKR